MITMLAALAGAVILAGGLYYLRGAGTDQESRKIYGVTARWQASSFWLGRSSRSWCWDCKKEMAQVRCEVRTGPMPLVACG